MISAKSRLFAGTLLSGALILAAAPAYAQATGGQVVEELVVTGSRIARPNLEQPTPITTITSEAIANSGTQSLGDVLAQLPALSSSGTVRANSDASAGVGGLSYPDLRNLGTSRTLTLVNGQRHVAADAGDTAVDLNTIPTALVDRVDVITGGASAIYGSDAVTGVINIILKDNFEGYQFDVQAGGPLNENYGQNYSASFTGGWNFADDRGNVTLTAFGDKQERVRGQNIRGLADWATVVNPANTGPADGIPDRIYRPYVQSEFFHRYGSIATFDLVAVTGFNAAGQPVAIPPRTGENNLFFGSFAAPCPVCDSSDFGVTAIPRQTRWGLESTFRYQITPAIRFRGDVKYVQTKTLDTFSPSFTTFEYGLDPDNAFITPGIQNVLNQFPNDGFLVSRINYDIGGRNDDTLRKTFRTVLGLDGSVDAGFSDVKWDLTYNFGRTRNKFHSVNGLIPGNFNAAIDAVRDPATGQIRCRKDVPSAFYQGYTPPSASILTNETCVPFNLFGEQNSPAARDYVTFEADRKHSITQQVATATAAFDTGRFFNLPGGAVEFATGVEWRSERSRNINDPFIQSGITETAPQPNALGGFEVKEAFLEVETPILRDAPWAYELTLNGAIRAADYSHAGKATAYMVRGTYAPIRDLTFRGTYSKATRAPNISEAFLPATPGFNAIFDPCEANSLDIKPTRQANCAALGVTFQNATDNQFPGVTSGNADLRSEKAETWTVGFVVQPRFAPGLSITLDYYNIKINDAISFLDPQDAADKCVDGPVLAVDYCNLILRDPATRQIQSYVSTYLNQAKLVTAGYDLQVAYNREIGDWTSGLGPLSGLDGRFTASLTANYTEKLRQFAFQDFPETVDREEGEIGDARWSFISSLAYNQGPVTLTWESQFIDKVRRNKDVSLERNDRPYVEAVWYHDLIARYRFDIGRGTEVFAGVNNIFDKTIPVGLTGNGAVSGDTSYDIFGRYLFAGVRARF
jgi:outer membrane receptor protein involved in Fe transport